MARSSPIMMVGNTCLPDRFGPPRGLFDGRGRGQVDHHDIRLHPRGQVADPVVGMQRAGAALRCQPPQLRRVQGRVAQLRHLIGGGHGAQHAERRPAAGIGGQADAQPGGQPMSNRPEPMKVFEVGQWIRLAPASASRSFSRSVRWMAWP
jgi:hypothetical protein